MIPWWTTSKKDIHFDCNISRGTMMATGTYNFAALRPLSTATWKSVSAAMQHLHQWEPQHL